MSISSPAVLLAGGRPLDPSAPAANLSRALQEFTARAPKVAYIGTANQDNPSFFSSAKSLLKRAGAAEVVLVHLATERPDINAAREVLDSADVVFISGGEVEDGMLWLVQHGLASYLKELYGRGKLFVGMSAGSIMMGTHWVRWEDPEDDDTAEIFHCLGLIPTVFDTHGEDEGWKELKTALKLMGPGARGYGIPRDGMITADSLGTLVSLRKELLCYINNNGEIQRG